MTSVEEVAAPVRHVALTQAVREPELGVELLALCQSIAADGSLSATEIDALREWLAAQDDANLPALAHLVPLVEGVVARGAITRDACRVIFAAIEVLLPPEVRSIARHARRTLEQRDAEQHRLQRDSQRPLRDARARNRPVTRLDFMVAGTRNEGWPSIARRFARDGDPIFLVRDPAHRGSRNAIQVRIAGGMQLGFVPEELASEIAPLLERGHPYQAEIKKMLFGGSNPVPVVSTAIFRSDSTVVDMVQPDEPLRNSPSLPVAEPPSTSGTLWKVLLAVVAAFVAYKLLR